MGQIKNIKLHIVTDIKYENVVNRKYVSFESSHGEKIPLGTRSPNYHLKPWYDKTLKERVRDRVHKVPHKMESNENTELFWKFGRYVCQCKRLSICYCPTGPASRGVRHWLDYEGHKFVTSNPQIAVYAVKVPQKSPQVLATYMNGVQRSYMIPNEDDRAIEELFEKLRTQSGRDWRNSRLRKPWISTQPSIQGTWQPFLYKPIVDINTDRYLDDGAHEDDDEIIFSENGDIILDE